DFKAPPAGEDVAAPPPPPGQPLPPGATPTPTPPPGQPPAKPEAALTLEVTPTDAAALSLAVAGNSPLDFILRPYTPFLVPVAPGTPGAGGVSLVVAEPPADVTRDR